MLTRSGYDGAVVSECGGHEWLSVGDVDAVDLTAAHLDLLRRAA